eukprot:408221_1
MEHIQTNRIKITLNVANGEIDDIFNRFYSHNFDNNQDEFLKHINSASKMRLAAQIDGYMLAVYHELVRDKNKLIALIDRTSDDHEWKIIKLFYTKLSTKKIASHMESTIKLLKHDSSYANFTATWLFDYMGLRNTQSSEQQASLHIEEEVIVTNDETKYDNE